LEAAIDFPDEDVPGGVVDQALVAVRTLREALTQALQDARGERVRDGFRVAILGRPNAGKSSLLNALAKRDAAIVTPMAGTTRDVIEVALDIAGYRVTLADTAGLRDAGDVIEAEGVRRAKVWAATAALRLYVVDVSAATVGDALWDPGLLIAGDLVILNKMDRAVASWVEGCRAQAEAFGLSVVDAAAALDRVGGVEQALERHVVASLQGSDAPAVTRIRHREALATANSHLDRALSPNRATELVAEDVRLAGRALAGLTGRVGAEDVLDKVFASFCIGK
jgi:tRNA modification GTPase